VVAAAADSSALCSIYVFITARACRRLTAHHNPRFQLTLLQLLLQPLLCFTGRLHLRRPGSLRRAMCPRASQLPLLLTHWAVLRDALECSEVMAGFARMHVRAVCRRPAPLAGSRSVQRTPAALRTSLPHQVLIQSVQVAASRQTSHHGRPIFFLFKADPPCRAC
jgi:hypothetical protein